MSRPARRRQGSMILKVKKRIYEQRLTIYEVIKRFTSKIKNYDRLRSSLIFVRKSI